MSTNNSFYRYEIESLNDISDSTYARRLTKASQNNKKSFIYIINKTIKPMNSVIRFLLSKIREQDYVLTDVTNHQLFCQSIKIEQCLFNTSNPHELKSLETEFNTPENSPAHLLLTPILSSDLKIFINFYDNNSDNYQIFWSFIPYNKDLKKSLTVKEINKYADKYTTLPGFEIYNSKIPAHYELEPMPLTSYKTDWKFSLAGSNPSISVIIPTYNNIQFLSNVVWHLINQDAAKESYEIIIIDDGSRDQSSEIIFSLFEKFKNKFNIQYIYWSKKHSVRGEQEFFRSGLARNLGARSSTGEFLIFLDSDMLTPENFITCCISKLQTYDIIQFQRFHINQELSKTNPAYLNIDIKKDTYIEEKGYWSELFFSENWTDLPNYWKYTCTYSLGISKKKFLKLGLFKKYYISYGFEDTDLGYEAFKNNYKFNLVKIPLLHLTSYDMMQYRNSFSKRFRLLSVTSELFYLQHLNKEIYHLLGNYYRAQKPIKSFFRDLIT